MKTLCVLLQNYYDIDIRVRRKTEALVASGYAVDVLALRSEFANSSDYVLNGVHVHAFSLGKKRGSKARYYFEYLTFFFWAFFRLSRLSFKKTYDVVDVNNLPDFLIFAALPAKLRGSRIVFDMHEITPEFLMSKYGLAEGHWQVRLAKFLERASLRFASRVITINEPIQRLLEGRGLAAAKSVIIMNAVDEEMFFAAQASPAAAAPAPSPGAFVMMYHGTLTPIYGLDIGLEALALARDEIPGAEFWIMGNGPEKGPLENLTKRLGLESRVRFLRPVLPQDVPLWLRQCDIGVLPTRRDVFLDLSFSNKLTEYIICGKAVAVSRLKTIHHYFSEDALAFFEPETPADLARQMVRLYRDRDLRARLAETAKREYAPISWGVMRRRYLKMMEDLTEAPRKKPAREGPPV